MSDEVEFTDEMKKYARRQVVDYQMYCEMRWDDLVWDLEMKLGINAEAAHYLAEDMM